MANPSAEDLETALAIYKEGAAHLHNGKPGEALAVFISLRKSWPGLPDGWVGVACALVHAKKPEEALIAVKQGLSSFADNAALWMVKAMAHQLTGSATGNSGAWADCLSAAQTSLARGGSQAELWTLKSMALLELGEFTRASETATEGLKHHPSNEHLYANAATSAMKRGKFKDARSVIDQGMVACHASALLLIRSAEIQIILSDLAQAEATCRQGLALGTHAEGFHTLLSTISNLRGEHLAAIEHAEMALEINPDTIQAMCQKLYALNAIGRSSEAIDEIQAAHKSGINTPEISSAEIYAWATLNQTDRGKKAFKTGLQLNKNEPKLWAAAAACGLSGDLGANNPHRYTPLRCLAKAVTIGRYHEWLLGATATNLGNVLIQSNVLPLLEHRLDHIRPLYTELTAPGRRRELEARLAAGIEALAWLDSLACPLDEKQRLLERGRLLLALGDPPEAYRAFDQIDQIDDTLLAGQVGLMRSMREIVKHDESVDRQVEGLADGVLADLRDRAAKAPPVDDRYYAGLAFYTLATDTPGVDAARQLELLEKSLEAFASAGGFAPAAWMAWHVSRRLEHDSERTEQLLDLAADAEAASTERHGGGLLIPIDQDAGAPDARPTTLEAELSERLRLMVFRADVDDAIAVFWTEFSSKRQWEQREGLRRIAAINNERSHEGNFLHTEWNDFVTELGDGVSPRRQLEAFRRLRRGEWASREADRLHEGLELLRLRLETLDLQVVSIADADQRRSERESAALSALAVAIRSPPATDGEVKLPTPREIIRLLYAQGVLSVEETARVARYAWTQESLARGFAKRAKLILGAGAAVGAQQVASVAGGVAESQFAQLYQFLPGYMVSATGFVAATAALHPAVRWLLQFVDAFGPRLPAWPEFREQPHRLDDPSLEHVVAWLLER